MKNELYEELKAKGLALDIEAIKSCKGRINCVIGLLKKFYNQLNDTSKQEFLKIINTYFKLNISIDELIKKLAEEINNSNDELNKKLDEKINNSNDELIKKLAEEINNSIDELNKKLDEKINNSIDLSDR